MGNFALASLPPCGPPRRHRHPVTYTPMDLIKAFLRYIRNEMGFSPLTIKAYGADLGEWAHYATSGHPERLDPMSTTLSDLRQWLAEMASRGASTRTLRRKVASLRSFYRYLMKYHGLPVNPAVSLCVPRVPKDLPVYIRPAETRMILDLPPVPDNFIEVRDHLILSIFYTTGIRCSELLNLYDANVDTARCELKVCGKRSKERVVPFGPELAKAIDEYRQLRDSSTVTAIDHSDPTAPLLVKEDGEPVYRRLLYNIVHTRLSDGGAHASRLSPHVLRHSCATDMLNSGAPIASVQQMLGHASLASTQVYTHVTYKDLQNNYQLAHPRAQKKGGPNGH